jgi:hypothetical protein
MVWEGVMLDNQHNAHNTSLVVCAHMTTCEQYQHRYDNTYIVAIYFFRTWSKLVFGDGEKYRFEARTGEIKESWNYYFTVATYFKKILLCS